MSEPVPDYYARLRVAERRLDDHQREIDLLRARWHKLSGLGDAVKHLTAAVRELHGDMPKMAKDAAERAVQETLERRAELDRDARADRRAGLGLRAQIVFGSLTGSLGLFYLLDRLF